MINVVYRIVRYSGETYPTIAPHYYTPEEFIDEYLNSLYINYKEVGLFDSIDDALYAFNNTQCAPARLVKMSNGCFYLYEVLILQSVFYDDEEGTEKTGWLSKKASSINE